MPDIEKIKQIVKKGLEGESTAHDYPHVSRVLKNAVTIAETENSADIEVVKAAALMHDFAYSDRPIQGEHGQIGAELARPILEEQGFTQEQVKKITDAIRFHNAFVYKTSKDFSLETNILRDADRLDALGHIGILRAIAYATSAEKDFVKVLEEQLDYPFVTAKGKELAKPRQDIIKEYISNLREDMGQA